MEEFQATSDKEGSKPDKPDTQDVSDSLEVKMDKGETEDKKYDQNQLTDETDGGRGSTGHSEENNGNRTDRDTPQNDIEDTDIRNNGEIPAEQAKNVKDDERMSAEPSVDEQDIEDIHNNASDDLTQENEIQEHNRSHNETENEDSVVADAGATPAKDDRTETNSPDNAEESIEDDVPCSKKENVADVGVAIPVRRSLEETALSGDTKTTNEEEKHLPPEEEVKHEYHENPVPDIVDSTVIPDTEPLIPPETERHTEIQIPNGPDVEILPDSQSPTRVYKLRFYILLMFSLLGFTQNMGWNTWGPLTKSAEPVFDWTDADIALLANWGPIAYVVSIVFFSWLMDVKGM